MAVTQVEQEIQVNGLTAPRITPADIEANISSEHYFTAKDGQQGAARCFTGIVPDALGQVTFCVLILRNGTKIIGINYGAIDPNQHSEQRGREEARAHAIEQVWPLMGYELRSKLNRGDINTFADEQLKWHGKLKHDLLNVLKISDPERILTKVEALVGSQA